MKRIAIFGMLLAVTTLIGCGGNDGGDAAPDNSGEQASGQTGQTSNDSYPAFVHTASEYPSWSTFMVAAKAGLINPEQGGQHGTLETKYGVDVVLQVKDYDPCITLYANGTCDSTCITNMDALNPAMGRKTTIIMPTSTSAGADKVIAVGATSIDDLKGLTTYGLAKSVSQYCFVRGLQTQGLNPADFQFKNLDPAPAATALQTGSGDVKAISVWNPFALQTLRTNKDAKEIFSSTTIPEEIIDCVVIGNDSLEKPKGKEYAACLCEIFYEVNKRLNSSDSSVSDATLTALGEDFSKLPLEDMRIVVQETRFYGTPAAGIALFENQKFQTQTMPTVITTCQQIGVLEEGQQPTVGFNDDSKQLNFTTEFMRQASQ